MESAGLISLSSSASKGIPLINKSDPAVLENLVEKLCGRLPGDEQSLFSPQEKDQIRQIFGLESTAKLESLVACSCELLLISTFHLLKVDELQVELKRVGLNQAAVDVFSRVLLTAGKQLCDRLKSNSIAPCQLEDLRWQLNVEVANSTTAQVNRPTCDLEFLLHTASGKPHSVPLQLNHTDLTKLFQSVEQIQLHLDKL